MIFNFRCKDCKSLQDTWYKELETNEFYDAESASGRYLKIWHSFKFTLPTERKAAAERYVEAATDLLYRREFKRSVEEFIWSLHCEGFSVREIELKLRQSSCPRKYKTMSVHYIIARIASEIKRE